MSGFECYQFRSFSRPLDKAERDEVSSWSSRTTASSMGATFSYSYGSFPKDEDRALLKYFDALLYFSSYGTRKLLLKFPEDTVDLAALHQFDIGREYELNLMVQKKRDFVLLEMYWDEEEGGSWAEEDDYNVGDFQSIHTGIIQGDYRSLYLFWLKVAAIQVRIEDDADFYDEDDDYKEFNTPPIPPNLNRLDTSLQALVELFQIEQDLITAAQNFSTSQKVQTIDYTVLLEQLPEEECRNFLTRLLADEAMLSTRLRKRLDKFSSKNVLGSTARPDIDEILGKKGEAKNQREEKEAKAAAAAHKAKMEKVRREEASHWKTVFFNLERKSGKSYDHATTALRDLQDAADFFGTLDNFTPKMREIREKYGRSRTLIARFDKEKLVK